MSVLYSDERERLRTRFPVAFARWQAMMSGEAERIVRLGLAVADALTREVPPRMRSRGKGATETHVYVAQIHSAAAFPGGTGPVKVGVSQDVRGRLEDLANGLPWDLLFVLQVTAACPQHEGAVHRVLRGVPELHVRGEWYAAEVLSVLNALPDEGPLQGRVTRKLPPRIPRVSLDPAHRAPAGKRHGRENHAPLRGEP